MTRENPVLQLLIVDDDPISRAILEEQLGASGHEVRSAESATAAMYDLEHTPTHIVLADWVMPGISGLDLCRWVRSRALPRAPHFVMITALNERDRLVEAFEAGADDYLSKPFHEAELRARLRAWTRLVWLQEALNLRDQEATRLSSELIELNQRLTALATQDELTGLGNRRAVTQRLNEHLAVASRYDRPLTCASIDIDRFKNINDTYGHAVGDRVLQHVASLLKSTTRCSDLLFRPGGDEFVVVMPHNTPQDAAQWAERFRNVVAATPMIEGKEKIFVTVSVGLAERALGANFADKLLNDADAALYSAKHSGRNAIRQAG